MNSEIVSLLCWNPCCEYDCCCCSLQTANIVTGIALAGLNLGFLLAALYIGVSLVKNMSPDADVLPPDEKVMKKETAILNIALATVISALNLTFLVTHIYASVKNKAKWLLPNFIYGTLLVVFLVIYLITNIVMKIFIVVGVCCSYGLILGVFLTIIYNFYEKLQGGDESSEDDELEIRRLGREALEKHRS